VPRGDVLSSSFRERIGAARQRRAAVPV